MKVLAVVLVIGFCLMAGAPLAGAFPQPERRTACCMNDESSLPGRACCQNPAGMQTCSCQTHSFPSAPSHSCQGPCSKPAALFSQYSGILLRIRNYVVRGYRRISGKNVLDHEIRQEIYHQIITHPGIDTRSLVQHTGLNENTLRYHLDKMEYGSKIIVMVTGGVCHFFENHGRYSEDEQLLLSRLFASGSSRILSLISTYPGLTRKELSAHLNVSGPTVTRRINHLISDQLVIQVRDGRYTRYYPGWDNLS